MEPLKHECGIALIRLRKPLEYYAEHYGTTLYGLNKLYLLMEKQHNRGKMALGWLWSRHRHLPVTSISIERELSAVTLLRRSSRRYTRP